ncbi:MAG: META domain-containing protein [Cocleimonas sp.]|nr:META domain-containing protein [Cocleimonas sp.]
MTIKFLSNTAMNYRRSYLLSVAFLSTAFFISSAMAAGGSTAIEGLEGSNDKTTSSSPSKVAPAIQSITATPTAECPLNSGGPSLLGTTWRLDSIYRNRVPAALKIDMRVTTYALAGNAGCNQYTANFKQVGYTGFNVKKIIKGKKACKVLIPYKTAKSINVGSWEGSYLRTLKRMGSVRQVTDTRLHFFNRNGEIGMKFRKIKDEQKEAAEATKKSAAIAEANKVAIAKKAAAEKEAQGVITQQTTSDQKGMPISEKSGEGPIIRKISSSDDDLIEQFFKTVEF